MRPRPFLLLLAGFALLCVMPGAVANSGGPDSFGYTFKDSDEVDGPVYNWVDIQDNGTSISDPADYVQGPFDLGFTFSYYGEERTEWWIGGDNGWLTLGNPGVSYDWVGKQIPSTAINTALIAPMWGDWQYCYDDDNVTVNGIYYKLIGAAPNQVFVVQFEQLRQGTAACTDTVSFEVLMYEATGNIVFQYKDNTATSFGGSASAGVQADGTTGLSYAFGGMNDSYYTGRAVEFYQPPPPDNELALSVAGVSEIIDIKSPNTFWAEIINRGGNNQTSINVSMEVYTIINESVIVENFNGGDPDGWTHGIFSGTRDGWGTGNAEDTWNRGKDSDDDAGEWDGEAMSAGRKGNGSSYPGTPELVRLLTDGSYDVDVKNGKIYVANNNGGTGDCGEVVIMDVTTQTLDAKYSPSGCYRPRAVTADDDGNVYFVTSGDSNAHLYKLSYNSGADTYTYAWMKNGSLGANYPLYYAMGVAYDSVNDEVLVSAGYTDTSRMYVSRWDPSNGDYLGNWSSRITSCDSNYCRPTGLDTAVVDGETHVFIAYYSYQVATANRGRVVEYSTDGTVLNSYYSVALGNFDESQGYHRNYIYDVASDGTNIYFGSYYGYYGGITSCTIGSPSSCTEAVPWTQIYPGQHHYTYGIAADSNYIYRATYGYDSLELHDIGSGKWVKTMGVMVYDSWLQMPTIDMSGAVGGTLTFSHSWGFYYLYEGAYLEASTDGGTSWNQVEDFTKGGYYYNPMVSTYHSPYDGKKGWTYYSFSNSQDMYNRTTGDDDYDYKWGDVELDLGPWAGETLDLRWRVGYCTHLPTGYNGWYRLDDVKVELLTVKTVIYNETITIDSIENRYGTARVEFSPFTPLAYGLELNDPLIINITIEDNYGDENLANNRILRPSSIKYVFFMDYFEDGNIDGWTRDTPYNGSNIWNVTDVGWENYQGYSLFSGHKKDQVYPGSTAIVSPPFDIPVARSAKMTYWHAYRFGQNYDGAIVEISIDGGTTWDSIAPSGYEGGRWDTISNNSDMQNPLGGMQGWTYSSDDLFKDAWHRVEYDLSNFIGETNVKLRWHVAWSNNDATTVLNGYYLDNIILFVEDLNTEPSAIIDSITPSPAEEFGEVGFSGSGFDIGGTILAYEWFSSIDDFLSMEKQFSTTNLSGGNHTITFRVQDDYGIWSNWDTAILFVVPNSLPIATIDAITPSSARFDAMITFNGNGTDSDGAIVGYEWRSSIEGSLGIQKNLNIDNLSVGIHNITLRVRDDDGEWSDWDNKTLEIYPNSLPVATIEAITSSSTRFDAEITFNGIGADSDGIIVGYEWYSDIDGFLSDEGDFSRTGFSVGTHTISLRVQDNDGGWSLADTMNLTIVPNSPPIATIESITWVCGEGDSDCKASEGENIYFIGSGTDSDGTLVAYWLECGPLDACNDLSGIINSSSLTFNFNISDFPVGSHRISLRVQDNDGVMSEDAIFWLEIYQDSDGDGIADEDDAFSTDPTEWKDTDKDGFGDNGDVFPKNPKEWADTDGDGVGDNGDPLPGNAMLNAWWQVGLILVALGIATYSASFSFLTRKVFRETEQALEEWESAGVNTDPVRKLLDEGHQMWKRFIHPAAIVLAWKARKKGEVHARGHGNVKQIFDRVEERLQGYEAEGVQVGPVRDLLEQARSAWNEMDFQKAEELARKAKAEGTELESQYQAAVERVTELKAKIVEFKEKGINTDELERVLAECEAEMGAATESEE